MLGLKVDRLNLLRREVVVQDLGADRGVDRPLHRPPRLPGPVHLDLIDRHTTAIEEITARIEVVMEPFRGFHDLISTIPGIGTINADIIIAETGADMTRFPTPGHLALWAGNMPGKQRVRRAGQVDQDPPRQPLPARSPRSRRDGLRAEPDHLPRRQAPPDRVAPWPDEGPTSRSRPDRAKTRALHQLESLGYHVTLDCPG